MDAVVDERTRFELYYPPFEGAIEAGVGSMMCSFNRINGVWSCGNNGTLNTDLRDRLGFKGFVMSDWGAAHSTSIGAGLDMEQPTSHYMGTTLLQGVGNGSIPLGWVNRSVMRILTPMFELGTFANAAQWAREGTLHSKDVTTANHTALARKIASSAAILLKNNRGTYGSTHNATGAVYTAAAAAGTQPLPLKLPSPGTSTIAVIGAQAKTPSVSGGGSGGVEAQHLVTPLQAIQELFGHGLHVHAPPPEDTAHLKRLHKDPGLWKRPLKDTAAAAGTCNAFTGVDYEYGDLRPLGAGFRNASSAADCCAQCYMAAAQGCKYYSFAPDAQPSSRLDVSSKDTPRESRPVGPPHNCWLKSGGTPVRRDRTSGNIAGTIWPAHRIVSVSWRSFRPGVPPHHAAKHYVVRIDEVMVHGGGAGVPPLPPLPPGPPSPSPHPHPQPPPPPPSSPGVMFVATDVAKAEAAAAVADVTVIVVGTDSKEGMFMFYMYLCSYLNSYVYMFIYLYLYIYIYMYMYMYMYLFIPIQPAYF